MTQPFGYLRSPASFIVIIIGCLIFADGNVFADYFSPGDHTITLTHQKRERSEIVHVPPRAIDAREIPIILNFHGGGGHGADPNTMETPWLRAPANAEDDSPGLWRFG